MRRWPRPLPCWSSAASWAFRAAGRIALVPGVRHGLDLTAAEDEIVLSRGELLLFDNLAIAHGRRGRRHPGDLHQLCIGFGSLDLTGQTKLLDRFLAGFDGRQGCTGAVTAEPGP
jgi:hypothetical protein